MFRDVYNYFKGMKKRESKKIEYSETINFLQDLNNKGLLQYIDINSDFLGGEFKKVPFEKVISYIEKEFKPGNYSYCVGMHDIYESNKEERHYIDLGSGHLIKQSEKENLLVSPDTETSLEFIIKKKTQNNLFVPNFGVK